MDRNTEAEMSELIDILNQDFGMHEAVGSKLSDIEINLVEKQLGKTLPCSYKIFLIFFGNGVYWLYETSIDDVKDFRFIVLTDTSIYNF